MSEAHRASSQQRQQQISRPRLRDSLTFRLIVPIFVVVAVVLGLATFMSYQSTSTALEEQARSHLSVLSQNATDHLAAQGVLAKVIAAAISANNSVQTGLASQDRVKLEATALPIWDTLRTGYHLVEMTFYMPPSTVFYRVHAPAQYGEDIAGRRPTVMQVLNGHSPIATLESDSTGLAIRGIAPIRHNNQIIGAVEIGIDPAVIFTEQILHSTDEDELVQARLLEVDPMLLHSEGEGDMLTPLVSFSDFAPAVEREQYLEVISSKNPAEFTMSQNGDAFLVGIYPLENVDGQVVALLELTKDHSATMRAARNVLIAEIGGGIILLLLINLLIWLFSHFLILKPLSQLGDAARAIAAGRFDVSLSPSVRRDPIGDVTNAFVDMKQRIVSLIEKIDHMAGRLASSSDELSNSIESVGLGTQQISSTVNDIAAGAGAQADAVNQVSARMAEVQKLSHDIMENTQEAANTIQATAEIMHITSEVLGTLGRRSDVIRRTVTTMSKFADETHLLALNAAVEAARVGAAGRGFAVLADEIRELATSSGKASEEISEQSTFILEEIEELLERIPDVERYIQQSVISGETIVRAARRQDENLGAIGESIDEISSIAEENAAATEELAVAIEEQNVSVEELVLLSQELARMAGELRTAVEQIQRASPESTQDHSETTRA